MFVLGEDVVHELVVLVVADFDGHVLQARAVGEAVEIDDVVLRVVLHEANDHMRGTGSEKARGESALEECRRKGVGICSYMKPAPPVTRIFLGVKPAVSVFAFFFGGMWLSFVAGLLVERKNGKGVALRRRSIDFQRFSMIFVASARRTARTAEVQRRGAAARCRQPPP